MDTKEIILDKRLDNFDVRLLLYFRFIDMNMCGLSISTNVDIASVLDKSALTVGKSIDKLVKFEYLFIDADLISRILNKNHKRVLIAKETYLELIYNEDRLLECLKEIL